MASISASVRYKPAELVALVVEMAVDVAVEVVEATILLLEVEPVSNNK